MAKLREAASLRRKMDPPVAPRPLEKHLDSLTGLPGRIGFENRLLQVLSRLHRDGHSAAILLLGLDRFKRANNSWGYAVGDHVLQETARRLQRLLEPEDVLARLGGDEFLVMKPLRKPDEVALMAQRVIESLQQPFQVDGVEVHLTVSIGISLFPQDGHEPELLLRNADSALMRAKEEGRNNYQQYTMAMTTAAVKRATLEESLRRAVQAQEFVNFYQPLVDLTTGRIVGMETLVRWQIPGVGTVPPAEFIGIAEETGLIVRMGEWVLQTACRQTKAWQKAGWESLRVAVNLSARQFQQKDLIQTISRVLEETRLEPASLDLEITESYAMQNADFTIAVLKELKKMGVRISIDDFGTGYSSLSYLKQFPIDTLKIDRSFVQDLSVDANDAAIAEAIIVLAHSLKLEVVAEGVETPEQLAILRRHRCDRMQGYLFSRPVDTAAFEELLRAEKRL